MIQPLFVVENLPSRTLVPGLAETHRDTPDSLLRQVESDLEKGVTKFLLFGVPEKKSLHGFNHDFTSRQIAAIRKRFGSSLWLSVDVCLCSHTSHGQCGVLNEEGDHVDNHATVKELAAAARAYAEAGADCVAPSDMMDGRVAAIRSALTAANCDRTLVMSYSAKFNSRLYGPFRVAADSAPKGQTVSRLKDRATYQIDPANPEDAYRSSVRDAEEGADILMVKPALLYLDVLKDLSTRIEKPWAAYEVSGEFAAIEALAEKGLIDRTLGHIEAWTSLTRAGATIIITYGARHAPEWLKKAQEKAQEKVPG
jgi:porphobilinogen synthase